MALSRTATRLGVVAFVFSATGYLACSSQPSLPVTPPGSDVDATVDGASSPSSDDASDDEPDRGDGAPPVPIDGASEDDAGPDGAPVDDAAPDTSGDAAVEASHDGERDAALEASGDAEGDAASDGSLDATLDARADGGAPGDATLDASSDAPVDASGDAGLDGGSDAAVEEAGDAGTPDAGSDAGIQDAGGPALPPCTTTLGTTCGAFESTAPTSDLHDGGLLVDTCIDGSPPQMTGGTIEDGTYVLTEVIDYLPTGGCNGFFGESTTVTLRFQGACYESSGTDVHGVQSHAYAEYMTTGDTFIVVQSCPAPSGAAAYSATPTTVSFLSGSNPVYLEVLTKVP
jgi:hypothetical protein